MTTPGAGGGAGEDEGPGLDPGIKLILVIPLGFVLGLLVLGLSVAIDWQW